MCSGANLLLLKHATGLEWLSKWEKVKQQLHVCQSTLPKVQISNSRESKTNVNEARALVIEGDVERLLLEISSYRRAPATGSPTRTCWLDEMKSLFKRIDFARENGCLLNSSLKARLNAEKALLMEDENLAKLDQKKIELVQKAKVQEASQSVPK